MDTNETLGVTPEARSGLIAFRACIVIVAACTLAVLAGATSWMVGPILLVCGLLLIARNTQAALCFIAFSIMPFGVVQQEVAGITFNLPEVLILLLAAKVAALMLVRRDGFGPRVPLVPLGLFAFSLVAAVGTGVLRQNGLVAVLQDFRQFSEFVVLFWLVLQTVRTHDQARSIALCFVLGAAFIACHGILQQFTFAGITEKQIASDTILHNGVRSGSFYGATALGGMMVLACGPALGVLLSSRRRAVQALITACILLCLFAVVFTKTRGSWLGLAVAIGYLAVSVRPPRRVVLGAGIVGLIFAVLLGPMIASRIATLADPAHDQSLMDRAQYYTAAWHIGRAHPVLGLGWGCYYDISEILKNEGYIRVPRPDADALAALAEEEGPVEVTVHSAYLQLFVKTGLLGVLGFFGVVLAWLERAWRSRHARRDEDPGWALYAGVTAGLAGYLFHSTFENFFQWPVMAQSFWLLMGLSFVLAPVEGRAARYRVPAFALVLGFVVFALFMFVCIRLERLHTDNFEQNVARALADGDMEKALGIASRAVDVEIDKPLPKAIYGRVLLQAGQVEEGLSQLRQAAGEVHKKGTPPSQQTGPACYFAPARLALGRQALAQGDLAGALAQFELAGADADLRAESFSEFHDILYEAWSRRGRWDRAVDFGLPDEAAQATMPAWSLVQIGQALADRARWDDLERVTDALAARGEFANELATLRGRGQLAAGDSAGAAVTFAQATGREDAAYLRGVALEAAGQAVEAVGAYRAVAQDKALRGMALARAAALLSEPATRQAALADLALEINQLLPVNSAKGSEAGALQLRAIGRGGDTTIQGGRFPLLLLWEDASTTADGSGISVAPGAGGEATVRLAGGKQLLQLQWVENQVNWESVERAYPGDTVLPGWIDAGREWFHLRNTPGFVVERAEDGDGLLTLPALSWIFSAAQPVQPGSAWLVLGRLRDPGGNANFGWQVVNGENDVIDMSAPHGAAQADGWSPRADFVTAGEGAAGVRLVFETNWPLRAPATLDDAALVAITVPVWP
ncbi:MAG: O-antigen ligase family protein [Candidatus Hydrogenedentes bacterium]|nr:O-antigen ligase family protein [Candidatus Hydrogenedentota bacterium]